LTGATALQTNARVAREYLVALPVELSSQQQVGLVRDFSQELSDRYGFAVDVAIHEPRNYPGSDPRNFHAHLLATTREVNTDGLGAKTALEWNDTNRREVGLGPGINELLHVRHRWATVTNEALLAAHVDARIDHRSLKAQGIDREPRPYIPRAAYEMERHGYRSFLAERLREDYQARVDARMGQVAVDTKSNAVANDVPESAAPKPQTMEEMRQQSVENWLKFRQSQMQQSLGRDQAPAREPARARESAPSRDDDLTL
jgi:ATP-dependent exoDNAse (exonuclease V) alpha subunit